MQFPSQQPVIELDKLSATWKKIISFLISPDLQKNVFPLKIFFIIIGALFIFLIVYFLWKSSFLDYWIGFNLKNFLTAKYIPGRTIQKKWQKIQKRIEKGSEANFKLAVIEAIELLKNVLQKKGYGKEDLLWQLKKLSKDEVSNAEELVEIYQIYQSILRDPDYRLPKERVKALLEAIERALKDLEVF